MNANEINEVLIAAVVFFSVLIVGLAAIHLFEWMHLRDMERELNKGDYPKAAKRKIDSAKQKEIDRLLEMDETESFYHENGSFHKQV